MKVLSIVESAYRATLEEQDDTVLWFCQSIKSGGADVDILLKGNAANYVVRNQDASGLSFGGEAQTQPPRLAKDVSKLIAAGAAVYAVKEDAAERGIEQSEAVEGIRWVARADTAGLLDEYDGVWYW